jgi:hypothetical protein
MMGSSLDEATAPLRVTKILSQCAKTIHAKHHPFEKSVAWLGEVLGLGARSCPFWRIRNQISHFPKSGMQRTCARETLRKDEALRKIHNISDQEMHVLSAVGLLGEVRTPRDFPFILNTIRPARGG